MRIVLTGAGGFLGWHTRVRLQALTSHQIVAVNRANWASLAELAKGADALVHVAGVNRAADDEIERDNVDLAHDVATAAWKAGSRPRIVYANSTQAGNGTAYGTGKAVAGELLANTAREMGGSYVDVRLPNLFGEHARPHYNGFVATFVDAVIRGVRPSVQDRRLDLVHVQAGAQALIDGLTTDLPRVAVSGTETSVAEVAALLADMEVTYRTGDFPPLTTQLRVDLFNTLRAALFPAGYPMPRTAQADARGRLVEIVRAHGGEGQTFVSTTCPAVTRGEHFHLGKVERFAVVGGRARISLRKLFDSEVVSFDVSGDSPVVVDMPTMWAHNITNVGRSELTTVFWTHTLFDPADTDTYPEKVGV